VLSQYCLRQIPVDCAQITKTMVFKTVGAMGFVVSHAFSFTCRHCIKKRVVIRIASITPMTIGAGTTGDWSTGNTAAKWQAG